MKTNKYKIGFWILLSLILLATGFLLNNYENNKIAQEAYTQGALSVSQSGVIPYLDNSTGNIELKTINFEELKDNWCGQ